MAQQKHTGGMGLFIIMAAAYVGMLILFGWQTWFFVDWLYPDDQLLMKVLTLICFDIMAFLWGCLEAFYRFATPGSRQLVRWAAAISFLLSLVTSVFYLILESIFRYHATATPTQIGIGYVISIAAVTGQFLFLFFWLYGEWSARHPYRDDYETLAAQSAPRIVVREVATKSVVSQPAAPALPAPKANKVALQPAKQTKDTTTISVSVKPIKTATARSKPAPTTQPADSPTTEALVEIADNEDFPTFDEDFEEIADSTYTKEVVAIRPGSQEAANARVPLSQRIAGAWQALTSDEVHGPTTLAKKRR